MSIINLEIDFFMTRRYMLVENSHTLYIINHSILHSSLSYIQLHITPTHSLSIIHVSAYCSTILSDISLFLFLFFFTSHMVFFYYLIFLHTIFQILYSPSPSSSFNVYGCSGPSTSKGPAFITIIVIILIPTKIGSHAINFSHRAPQ